jgi:uncharacterized protein (DUF58 family)
MAEALRDLLIAIVCAVGIVGTMLVGLILLIGGFPVLGSLFMGIIIFFPSILVSIRTNVEVLPFARRRVRVGFSYYRRIIPGVYYRVREP